MTEILEQWQISKLMPLSVVSFPNLPSINLKIFREFFNTHIFISQSNNGVAQKYRSLVTEDRFLEFLFCFGYFIRKSAFEK